jgi:hypothetical protein
VDVGVAGAAEELTGEGGHRLVLQRAVSANSMPRL